MSDEQVVDTTKQGTGFSAEYVKELRTENASWRTKARELEDKVKAYEGELNVVKTQTTIKEELQKRGVEGVEPKWIEVPQGQTVEVSVDNFLKNHPQFTTAAPPAPVAQPLQNTDKPMSVLRKNTNVPALQSGDYFTIKKDPIARAKLRESYRGLLAEQSHNHNSI